MPKAYNLKKSPFSKSKLERLIKTAQEKAFEDRRKAVDIFKYFETSVKEGHNEDKEHMISCLKLLQTSTTNIVKIIEAMAKSSAKEDYESSDLPNFNDLIKNDLTTKPRLPSSRPSLTENSND